jgi:hypothetical protein
MFNVHHPLARATSAAARLETFHEFPRPMIRIGGVADLGRVRCELRAAFQQFGKLVAAGGVELMIFKWKILSQN